MKKLGIKTPEPTVNIDNIRRKYHEAVIDEKKEDLKQEFALTAREKITAQYIKI